MLKRICDKCGCEIKTNEYYHVHTCILYSDRVGTKNNIERDLCEDCYKALLRFLKKEREE